MFPVLQLARSDTCPCMLSGNFFRDHFSDFLLISFSVIYCFCCSMPINWPIWWAWASRRMLPRICHWNCIICRQWMTPEDTCQFVGYWMRRDHERTTFLWWQPPIWLKKRWKEKLYKSIFFRNFKQVSKFLLLKLCVLSFPLSVYKLDNSERIRCIGKWEEEEVIQLKLPF